MSGPSKIEWLQGGCSWNPIVGCSHAHVGCEHCYGGRMATRLVGNPKTPQYKGIAKGGKWTGKVRLVNKELTVPLRWRKPRRIFVCSMGDLFHGAVPDEWRDKVHAVMALTPEHEYILLTKRPANARTYYTSMQDGQRKLCEAAAFHLCSPPKRILGVCVGKALADCKYVLPNLTLGYSASDQATLDAGIGDLLATSAARRVLSLEPLLGPIRLPPASKIELVIAGAETGPGRRTVPDDLFRSVRDQCAEAGVPFFLKRTSSGSRLLDGRTHEEWCDGR